MEFQASSATLSNGHSFAGKSKYDVEGFGAPPDSSVRSFASGIEDYGEIFGGSRASIPILDVPALKEPNVSLRARRSKLEYSKIFGGFSDSDFGVPHEELLAKPKKEQSFSDKARTRVETGSSLVGSEPPNFSEENHVFSHEASYQSFNGIKRFNMSYQKTNQGSKNGTNETMRIAQLHAVPGYTRIVDDISNLTERMMEGNQCSKSVSSVPPGSAWKQNSEGSLKFQNKPSWNRSISNDKLFDAYEFGTHSSKVSSPSSSFNFGMTSTVGVSRSDASESEAGVYSPPYLDEEVDANSVAATSAAAVRKAIEEAQAKIRIAKELMEKKKEGFQSRAKPSFKDGLRAGKRREEKIVDELKRSKKEASEKLDPPMQAFSGTGKQSMIKEHEVTADFMDSEEHFTEDFMDSEERFIEDFMDSEERFTAEETIEEKYGHEFISTQVYHTPEKLEEWGEAKQLYETAKSGKNRAMTLDFEQGEDVNKKIQSIDEWKGTKTAQKSFEKIVENAKEAEEVCKWVEIEKKVDAIKGAQEWEECPIKIKTAQEVHDWEENGQKFEVTPEQRETEKILEVSYEQEKREEKLQELQEPIRIEKKLEVQELETNFYMNMLKQAEWENEEIQEEAHEKAENENNRSKNVCESEENEGRVKEICGQEDNGTKHKEAYEGVEYEEKKEQVDAHQGEDTEKSLDKVHVQEVMEEISSEFLNREEGEKSHQGKVGSEEIGMLKGAETNVRIVEETCKFVETERIQTEINQRSEHEKMKTIPEALKYQENDLEAGDGVSKQDDNENESDTQESCRHTENDKDAEITPEVLALEENIKIGTVNKSSFGPKENENESEAIGVANDLQVTAIIDTAGSQDSLEPIEIEKQMKEAMEAHSFNKIRVDVLETDLYLGQKQNDQHEKASKIVDNLEQRVGDMAHELEENYKIVEKAEVANNKEENKNNYESSHEESWIDNEEAGAWELEKNNKNVKEAGVANNQEENDNNYESSHEESWIDNEEAEARILEENNKNAEEAEVVNNQEEYDNNYESSHEESWIDNEEAKARILGENNKNVEEAEVANNQEENDNNYESSHEESWIDNEEAEVCELEENNKNVEEAEVANKLEENDNNYESSREDSWIDNEGAEARVLGENNKNVGETEVANNQEENDNNYESSHEESWIDNEEAEVYELEENNKNVEGAEFANNQEENENYFESSHEESWIDNEKKLEAAQLPGMFEEKGKSVEMDWEVKTRQIAENSEENHHETLTMEKSETKDTSEQEMELNEEHLKKINEAKEREREREKERIAVERAIREARERAFAEARERAAVERAAAEARRRVMAEANNKSSSEKTSMEAKLKAERAAVERATAEARERALEKALSERAAFEARNQTEKLVVEKSSNSSRDYKMRQSFKSYDPQHNGSSSSSNSRYPNSSNNVSNSTEKNDGANGESDERCKARSERHQRIAERAAKALAEKNKRDLLAQREQAEKNKLADALDADIKRWSSGKEKNLRALLSTLQYILGPDSGWKPIPLTDIIAATAVKKAYRKATLCVHPDKLQQRGATIQQKYICEKVFDLLKEAWNKFSAEER